MNDVSPGKLTVLIGAAVTFIFSFLPWYSVSGFGSKFSRSAWQSGFFPVATWVPVFALIIGFIAAVQAFKFLELPEKLWEFTLDQIVVVLSIMTVLLTLGYLIMDQGGASIGFGLILCLLGSIAMVAGFFMDRAGVGVNPNATTGGVPGQPGQPGFEQPGQAPGGHQAPPAQQPMPPQQAMPPQQPPTQQPPAPQPPPQDPGSF